MPLTIHGKRLMYGGGSESRQQGLLGYTSDVDDEGVSTLVTNSLIGLHTGDPSPERWPGAFRRELSGGGYARSVVDGDGWQVAADGSVSNASIVRFPLALRDWLTATHFTVSDPTGAVSFYSELSSALSGIERGDSVFFLPGDLTLNFRIGSNVTFAGFNLMMYGNGLLGDDVWLGLHTGNPVGTGGTAANELPARGGYARTLISRSEWSGLRGELTRQLDFPLYYPTVPDNEFPFFVMNGGRIVLVSPTESWGTVTHISLNDSQENGLVLWHRQLPNPLSIVYGPRPVIFEGDIILTDGNAAVARAEWGIAQSTFQGLGSVQATADLYLLNSEVSAAAAVLGETTSNAELVSNEPIYVTSTTATLGPMDAAAYLLVGRILFAKAAETLLSPTSDASLMVLNRVLAEAASQLGATLSSADLESDLGEYVRAAAILAQPTSDADLFVHDPEYATAQATLGAVTAEADLEVDLGVLATAAATLAEPMSDADLLVGRSNRLTQFDVSPSSTLALRPNTYSISPSSVANGIVWSISDRAGEIWAQRISDGAILLRNALRGVDYLWTDGSMLWVLDNSLVTPYTVTQSGDSISLARDTRREAVSVPTNTEAIWSDGQDLWLLLENARDVQYVIYPNFSSENSQEVATQTRLQPLPGRPDIFSTRTIDTFDVSDSGLIWNNSFAGTIPAFSPGGGPAPTLELFGNDVYSERGKGGIASDGNVLYVPVQREETGNDLHAYRAPPWTTARAVLGATTSEAELDILTGAFAEADATLGAVTSNADLDIVIVEAAQAEATLAAVTSNADFEVTNQVPAQAAATLAQPTSDADLSVAAPQVGFGPRLATSDITLNRTNSNRTSPLNARGMWTDGTTMWVADSSLDSMWAYTVANDERDSDKDFSLSPGATSPTDIWSDGTTMWVTNGVFPVAARYRTIGYTLATGARDSTKDLDAFSRISNPQGSWSDGTTLWVYDFNRKSAFAFTLATGDRDSSKDYATTFFTAQGSPFGTSRSNVRVLDAWSNGTTIWFLDDAPSLANTAYLRAFNVSDRSRDADKDITLALADVSRVHGHGTTLWVLGNVSGGQNELFAYSIA